jgi:hypothetical protein
LFFTLKDKISLISMPKKVMWCDCHTCTVMWENSYPTDYCTAYFKISKRHEGDRHLKFDCQNMPWIYHDSYSHWFTFVSMIFSLIYICISDILIDLHLYQWYSHWFTFVSVIFEKRNRKWRRADYCQWHMIKFNWKGLTTSWLNRSIVEICVPVHKCCNNIFLCS